MSVPEGIGSDASPSLFASIRAFGSVAVAILYTRLDLVTAELEEEAARGLKLIVAGLISVLCLFVAWFFAMYFLIAIWWDTDYRRWVIGGIFAFYLLAGVALLFAARNMILSRPRFLSQTLAELKRDAEGLSRAVTVKKEETRP